MLLWPTDKPSYLSVVKAARDGGLDLPPELAHLFIVLATHHPEIRPRADMLASFTGTSVRTVRRNLTRLAEEHRRMATVRIDRGVERGGVAWRFLVLPTLSLIGEDPVLAGRGPERWDPTPLAPGQSLRLTVASDGRWVPAAMDDLVSPMALGH